MQESKLSVVVERVLDTCLAPSTAIGEGCDNMTMILVQFKKDFQSNSSLGDGTSPVTARAGPDSTESVQKDEFS